MRLIVRAPKRFANVAASRSRLPGGTSLTGRSFEWALDKRGGWRGCLDRVTHREGNGELATRYRNLHTRSRPAGGTYFLAIGRSGKRLLTLVRSWTERIACANRGATVTTEMFSG